MGQGFIDASREAVHHGEATVGTVIQALGSLRTQIDVTAGKVEGIQALATRQTLTSAGVASQVEQNDHVAQLNADASQDLVHAVEEFARTALDLGRMAGQLATGMKGFHI